MKIGHALSIIYIFKQDEEAKNLFDDLTKKFALTEHKDDVNYKYKFYSNDNCCLEWLSFNSVIGIHILIEKQDKGFADTWAGYKSSFEQSVEYPKSSEFFGASILYWGFLDTEIDKSRGREIIENELGLKTEQSTELKQGGVLWLIKDYNQKSKAIEYAIFSPKLNLKKREFILKIIHLLMPIELSAHIQRDQIKHYKNHRDELLSFMEKLNTATLNMLKAFNIKSSESPHNELDKLSKLYSGFVGMVSWANNILNTAQIELSNYKELADKISKEKEEDEIFEKQLRNFEKEIEQVRYDLNYCDSTIKNANTGLELLRVADSARMQKQGLIQQAALTVIEVVFVFYYSLGVWHFIVAESVWEHIAPLGKLGFGFTLATTVPLFAHFLVEKKWKYSFACLAFIFTAVAYACWVTSSLL
jgi:hypothetical protein